MRMPKGAGITCCCAARLRPLGEQRHPELLLSLLLFTQLPGGDALPSVRNPSLDLGVLVALRKDAEGSLAILLIVDLLLEKLLEDVLERDKACGLSLLRDGGPSFPSPMHCSRVSADDREVAGACLEDVQGGEEGLPRFDDHGLPQGQLPERTPIVGVDGDELLHNNQPSDVALVTFMHEEPRVAPMHHVGHGAFVEDGVQGQHLRSLNRLLDVLH
mmetsp:Transcript_72414/g.155025  ORF Transcript_72414/g.155025 Transcript_72414/m.155025 type:complete len:216 (+) Transcript_72414:42-689(+)